MRTFFSSFFYFFPQLLLKQSCTGRHCTRLTPLSHRALGFELPEFVSDVRLGRQSLRIVRIYAKIRHHEIHRCNGYHKSTVCPLRCSVGLRFQTFACCLSADLYLFHCTFLLLAAAVRMPVVNERTVFSFAARAASQSGEERGS